MCETLFSGSATAFSAALRLNHRHVYHMLFYSARITVSMLSQIVACTNVRAEWLLTGTGPMFVDAANQVEQAFTIAPYIRSSFTTFETGPVLLAKPACINLDSTKHRIAGTDVAHAARAIHDCRVTGKPVCFFLGADAFSVPGVFAHVHEFLTRGYVTSLAMTAGCVPADLHITRRPMKLNLNYVARLAAIQGIGMAEALGRALPAIDNKKPCLLASLLNSKTPATVHVELGELAAHLQPGISGAATGAAIGAAAYVDLLVFAEQVRLVGEAGGMFVVLGETDRGIRLIKETITAVQASFAEKPFAAFHIFTVAPPYFESSGELLKRCQAVFDGTAT